MKKFVPAIICTILILVITLIGGLIIQAKLHPVKFKNQIETYANEFNLPPALVASLINTESSYNQNARSNKNAIGLMQIKLSTAEYMITFYKLNTTITENELYDVNKNLYFGCMYLNYLFKKFDNFTTAIASYNAGETNVRAWLKNVNYSNDGKTLTKIPFNETDDYVKKINKNLKFYKKIYK